MRKAQYLAHPDVAEFLTWLHSNEARFLFAYTGPRHQMHARGLDSAADTYQWNGRTLTATTTELTGLRTALRSTLDAGNSYAHCAACIRVLEWGHVVRSNSSFYEQLNSTDQLINYHRVAHGPAGWYHSDSSDDALASNTCLRISAGTIKVHSLLEDELVIYDSRVAAAMGWLVERYCDNTGLRQIPQSLEFCLPAPRPGTHRNPAVTRSPQFSSRADYRVVNPQASGNWVRDSLRTSWIVSGLLDARECEPHMRTMEFLKLQLGLFMIGYDLRSHRLDD